MSDYPPTVYYFNLNCANTSLKRGLVKYKDEIWKENKLNKLYEIKCTLPEEEMLILADHPQTRWLFREQWQSGVFDKIRLCGIEFYSTVDVVQVGNHGRKQKRFPLELWKFDLIHRGFDLYQGIRDYYLDLEY